MSSQTHTTYTFSNLMTGGDMLESGYKQSLVPKIFRLFPNSRELVDMFVLLGNPNEIQGIPDIIVIRRNKWAMLEVKRSEKSKKRPNQDWYVDNWNMYVFASFIYPENEIEVLRGLQQALAA